MDKIRPMLAKDGVTAVNDKSMIWQSKYDGARALAFVNGSSVFLQARSGTNKTDTFPELRVQTKLPAIVDGEIVPANGESFQDGIQTRINTSNTTKISLLTKSHPAKYMVFDVLEIDGKNVESLPLVNRIELLNQTLVPTNNVELAPWYDDGEALFAAAKAKQLEGIIGKTRTGRYERDVRGWIKVKCWQQDTFMVVGYTDGTGWRKEGNFFGALELANMKGQYVGEVGTGFNNVDLANIMKMFSPGVCPFPREPEKATWVKPFAIKVRFLEYSNDGILRFPSFRGVI